MTQPSHESMVAAARTPRIHGWRRGSASGYAVIAGSVAHREGVTGNPFDGEGEERLANSWRVGWDAADEASRQTREVTHCHHTAEK